MSLQSASTYIHLHDRTGVKSGQTLPLQAVKYIDTDAQLMAWRERLYRERKGKKKQVWSYLTRAPYVPEDTGAKARDRGRVFSTVGTIDDLRRSRSQPSKQRR
ncbi:unnamed protein product [Amoebophrya sp. A25]|nr:unnamed protein product [Amoebophrya sp. A25]|eukprot:GSA25T00001380001.1